GLPTLAIPPGPKPPRYGINQSYVRALTAAGCAPVLIPILDDDQRLRAIYERLDGIVFPGGADIAPGEYHEEPIGDLNVIEAARDRTELTLARWAFADDLPILGICRGQQVLNVALGGSLWQDLRHQGVTSVEHSDADGRARSALIHRVRLDPNSRLAQLIDETSFEVNSLHHQAVKSVAPPRGQGGRRITGGPPRGTLRWIAGALRGALEDLPVGIPAERGQRVTPGGLDDRLRAEPGLLLPLADQGSRRIAQPEQSLVEAIYQGSARGRIAILDKGPAHARAVRRPGSAACSSVPGPSPAPAGRRWPDGSSSHHARSAAGRRGPPRCDTAG